MSSGRPYGILYAVRGQGKVTARPTRRPVRRPLRRVPGPTVLIGVAVAVAVVLFTAALLTGPIADAHHAVVTVNGRTLDRTQLRAQLALNQALATSRRATVESVTAAHANARAEHDRLLAGIAESNADPLRAAIDNLVRDELLLAAARDHGMDHSLDVEAEIGRAAVVDVAVLVDVIAIADPASLVPSAGSSEWTRPAAPGSSSTSALRAREAALDEAHAALADGRSAQDIAAGLTEAGWRASGGRRWIPSAGRIEGLPDSLVQRVRDPATEVGALLGAAIDPVSGVGAVATVTARGPASSAPAAGFVANAHVDADALRRWAAARAAERWLRDELIAFWTGSPQAQVRVREVVVGSATVDGVDGLYTSFSHIVVVQLLGDDRPTGSVEAAANQLAAELKGLPPMERSSRWDHLVATANATITTDPLRHSGELGYYTNDQLIPELASAAFAPGITPRDVLGPITTSVGPELFLVRARFQGTLDERSIAALVEARMTSDLLAFAERVSPPGAASRASGSLWRAEAEVAESEAIRRAYGETPIGGLSDPIALAGELLVVRPEERRTAPLEPDAIDRLLVAGFDVWIAALTNTATIERDPEPLPGVRVEPSPTAVPSDASASAPIDVPSIGLPTQGSGPPPFAVPTPRVVP